MITISQQALQFASSFEAEVFVHLLLRNWKHPLSEDQEFRNDLLEHATDALQTSVDGMVLLEPLASTDMNFIAAVWYVEWTSLNVEGAGAEFEVERRQWLMNLKRELPSCFCDTKDLPP